MTDSSFNAGPVTPLLRTKFFPPVWRPGMVSRPRLLQRLETSLGLSLISAPAGYGKTTLLAEWLSRVSENKPPVGWLSADVNDSDTTLFWSCFISALQESHSACGKQSQTMLATPKPPSIHAILSTLINEISGIKSDLTLVVDDYHVIGEREVHDAMAFFIENMPPNLHLVIASRVDLPISVARLRSQGVLNELQASDLRFTYEEAISFLQDYMGVEISKEDIHRLEGQTEGWIAGLQLAALSMQGRSDHHVFLDAFAGNDRNIADFLVEEVLDRQNNSINTFLMQTAVLDRLCGPLCDAVTGQKGATEMLRNLERQNLFIVPLDERRQWYRYHHLFSDVLRVRLEESNSQVSIELHQRASAWYEKQGYVADAIHHAFGAEDFERATALVERMIPSLRKNRQEATSRKWLSRIPEEMLRVRPVLNVAYAFALLMQGEVQEAEIRMRNVERWVESCIDNEGRLNPDEGGMIVESQEELQALPAMLAVANASFAQAVGDIDGVEFYAQKIVELEPEDELLSHAAASALLGLASWARGDLEKGYTVFDTGMRHLELVGNLPDAISGTLILGDIRIAQGRFAAALDRYQKSLRLAVSQGKLPLRGTGDVYIGLAKLCIEQYHISEAMEHLKRSEQLGELGGLPENQYRWFIAKALIQVINGNPGEALDNLFEAEQRYMRGYFPEVDPVAAYRARIWILQGRLSDAWGWIRDRALSIQDELVYLREFEHISLVRLLIASYRNEPNDLYIIDALTFLKRLREAAEAQERNASLIEIFILEAIAFQLQGEVTRGVEILERALVLAEPEHIVRVFIAEGEAMRNLLRHAVSREAGGRFARYLLSEFFESPKHESLTNDSSGLVSPLTTREIEILQLVASGMRNQAIADHLFISVATVKRHISNIYGKLDVSHRIEAVARAMEMNIL